MSLNIHIREEGSKGLIGGPNEAPYVNKTFIGISAIDGKGLMAAQDLGPNEFIGLAHSNGTPTEDIGRWYNHSEKPNTTSIMMLGGQRYLKPLRK